MRVCRRVDRVHSFQWVERPLFSLTLTSSPSFLSSRLLDSKVARAGAPGVRGRSHARHGAGGRQGVAGGGHQITGRVGGGKQGELWGVHAGEKASPFSDAVGKDCEARYPTADWLIPFSSITVCRRSESRCWRKKWLLADTVARALEVLPSNAADAQSTLVNQTCKISVTLGSVTPRFTTQGKTIFFFFFFFPLSWDVIYKQKMNNSGNQLAGVAMGSQRRTLTKGSCGRVPLQADSTNQTQSA